MTPPAAAAASPRTRTRTRRAGGTASPPRRVSGPVRTPSRGRTAAAAPPPLALRLGGAVHSLAEHHFLDRLIRGRAWIALIAVGLIGIVFMQVSMLRLNAGIGQAVERSSTLERENSAMRAAISELSSIDRIAAEAGRIGLVLAPGTPRFLDARSASARRAAATIAPPGQGIVPSATQTTTEVPVDHAAAASPPVLGATGVAAAPETDPTTIPETGAAPAPEAADPAAAPPHATDAHAAEPAQEQAAAPPPAAHGGMDASGQVG